MTHLIIRPAKISNSRQLSQVVVTTWKETYRGLIDTDYLSQLEVNSDRIQKWHAKIHQTKDHQTFVFVALVDHKIVGFIWGGVARQPQPIGFDFEIYAFYVLPQFQGQGIGTQLFTTFKNQVGPHFFLWMLAGNKSEIIYQQLGGKTSGFSHEICFDAKPYREIAYVWE